MVNELKIAGGVLFACIGAAAIFGWIMNIVKIFGLVGGSFDVVGVELIIRGVCVFFAPLGAIAGWM